MLDLMFDFQGGCQDTSLFYIKLDRFIHGEFDPKTESADVTVALGPLRKPDERIIRAELLKPQTYSVESEMDSKEKLDEFDLTQAVDPNLHLPCNAGELFCLLMSNKPFRRKCAIVGKLNEMFDEKEEGDSEECSSVIFKRFPHLHLGFIYSVTNVGNTQIVTGSSDATIKIWSVDGSKGKSPSPQLLRSLEGHKHSVVSLSVIGFGMLVSASMDGTLKSWNVGLKKKAHLLWTMNNPDESEIVSMTVLCNGRFFVSGSRDGFVRFWDSQTYDCIYEFFLGSKEDSPTPALSASDSSSSSSSSSASSLSSSTLVTDGIGSKRRSDVICAMALHHIPPSTLLIATTNRDTEVWDVSPLIKLYRAGPTSDMDTSSTAKPRITSASSSAASSPSMTPLGGMVSAFPAFGSPFRLDGVTEVQSITELLEKLSLQSYIDQFKREEIDLLTLRFLNDCDLRMIGLPFGPRTKIRRFLQVLQSTADAASEATYKFVLSSPVGVSDEVIQPLNLLYTRMLSDLREFVRIPSVSEDPSHRQDCYKAAVYYRDLCDAYGAETRFLKGKPQANPVVLARFRSESARHPVDGSPPRTIVVYGHYDVVPAGELDRWNTDPFDCIGRDGYLYGRGTTDNKGPLIAYAFALKELLSESMSQSSDGMVIGEEVPFDVIIIAEGHDEHDWEQGGLIEVIKQNRDWLSKENVKLILCSNSYWLGDRTPCLVYSMRGLLKMRIVVKGPNETLHSGVHGGVFSEPIMDLCKILSQLQTDDGKRRVLIPHFYDEVLEMTEDEQRLYDEIDFNCQAYLKSIGGISQLCFDDKHELLSARGRQPTLSIQNIALLDGDQGQSSVIASSVSAVISMRTVPNQKNEDIYGRCSVYIRNVFDKLKSGNSLTIELMNSGDHWQSDPLNPFYRAASDAIEEHWHLKPFLIRAGGTLPTMGFLNDQFCAPFLQLPLGQNNDHAHLPNERLCVKNLLIGKDVIKDCIRNCFSVISQEKRK